MELPHSETSTSSWNPTTETEDQTWLREILLTRLRSHNALPFLFIGSGMSRRYLDLPDWVGILRRFSGNIGTDVDYYLATSNGDLPRAATLLAKDFHEAWFNEDRYRPQREAHRGEVHDNEAALKIAIAEYIKQSSTLKTGTPGVDSRSLELELKLLSSSVIDGVITTNYDGFVDQVFEGFESYVGQDELLLSDAQFIAEIYKIHGSCDQPESLVVTERDYANFAERNPYLAAKLLTIFAEHPVIFLGYSLSDKYIREIINSIAKAVGPKKINSLSERIYFVEWNADPLPPPTVSQYFMEVSTGQALPVTKVDTNSFLPIFDSLARLERPFPAKVLRELRKHVFDLVTRPEPGQARESVRVAPFDSDEAEGLRVVFGVGEFSEKQASLISDIGFRALTRDDLARDVLGIRERRIDSDNVLRLTLPELTRGAPSSYLPVWKYIRDSKTSSAEADLDLSKYDYGVRNLADRVPIPNEQTQKRFDTNDQNSLKTPRDVFSAELARYYKFDALLCLDPSTYELDELREVLVEQFDDPENETQNNRTSLFKAIAHYDRLRWGPKF